MLDSIPSDVERVGRERIARNEAVTGHSLACAARGNPLAAEGDPARLVRRLMAKNQTA